MTETKRFPLRTVLTVTTGRLLTALGPDGGNGIGDLYEILGWMTKDSPNTHQLPRFNEECRPWLLRWFPELAKADERLGNLDILLGDSETPAEVTIKNWVETERERCGLRDAYDVPRIPQDDHERKHPWQELVEMRGSDEGIVVVELPKN